MKYSSPASSLSDPELLAYSQEHLKYEIGMFFSSGVQLSKIHFPESDPTSVFYKNALVEAFANHIRNLLLFLYPHKLKKDDVISDYFFSDPVTQWKRKRPKQSVALREARTRASQEISHLTVSRKDSEDASKKWPVSGLMEEIKGLLKIFVANASSGKLDSSVKELIDNLDSDSTFSKTFTAITACTSTACTSVIVVGGNDAATNHPQGIFWDATPVKRT